MAQPQNIVNQRKTRAHQFNVKSNVLEIFGDFEWGQRAHYLPPRLHLRDEAIGYYAVFIAPFALSNMKYFEVSNSSFILSRYLTQANLLILNFAFSQWGQ